MASEAASLRRRAERAALSLPDLRARAERAAASVLAGEDRQRQAGAGERFWQFRPYETFDRPRDIDWRRSARGDRVFVRQKELQTTQTAYFWTQGGPGMAYRSASGLPTKREEAATLALALAILSVRDNERIAPLNGEAARRGEPALMALTSYLADPPSLDTPFPTLPLRGRERVVLAGDFLDDPIRTKAWLGSFAAFQVDGTLIQVLDPAELDFPFAGRLVFTQPGADENYPAMDAASLRDAYLARLAAHNEVLRELCRAQGWRYLLHRGGTDCGATLLRLWTGAP